jgi:hypothetical protein
MPRARWPTNSSNPIANIEIRFHLPLREPPRARKSSSLSSCRWGDCLDSRTWKQDGDSDCLGLSLIASGKPRNLVIVSPAKEPQFHITPDQSPKALCGPF